ncbi:neural-cadherin-like [Penaeus indicus]|uniref:neural-cadherin-like n=1 Tax=Penaeus indicus TaxID=29960 RepID=UPI00300D5DD8
MVAVQLMDGRPQVLVEGEAGSVKLEVSTPLHDGDWHAIHLQLDSRGVVLMVDMCGRGWEESASDSHCVARAAWPRGGALASWAMPGPMQLGGLAHDLPSAEEFGWSEAPTTHPLDGCVSHLTVNGQLVDLGQPAYTHGSVSGCRPQDAACPGRRTACGLRGACVGGLSRPRCECEPGWTGPSCATPTVPTALGSLSYVKLALSFAPPPTQLSVQLRVRTRGPKDGLLMQLSAQHRHVMFTLQLRAGVACASVSGAGWAARAACVEGRPVGDGAWHTVRAERHGHNLLVSVDDGDGWRRNESLVTLEEGEKAEGRNATPPAPLHVDKHDGVTLGGLPEFVGVSLIAVRDDLKDTCLDDVRVSGRPLPLPPSLNATKWGQVTTSEHLGRGCPAGDPCVDTKCPAPLLCTNTWRQATCSCGGGRQQVGGSCQNVNECTWAPCLHDGTCYNLHPGYQCVCGPGYTGENCQWAHDGYSGLPFSAPAAIAAVTLSFLLLVVVGVVVSLRLHRHWRRRERRDEPPGDTSPEEVAKGVKESPTTRLAQDVEHESFLERLKIKASQAQPALQKTGEKTEAPTGGSPCTTMASKVTAKGILGEGKGKNSGTVPEPLLPQDDLRAYAYEGDGSSAGSLGSAVSGLRSEVSDEGGIRPLVSDFLEVMDLLRNLPDKEKTTTSDSKTPAGGEAVRGSPPAPTLSKSPSKPTPSPAKIRQSSPGNSEMTTAC